MKSVGSKRKEWLAQYRAIIDVYSPTECARCGLKGRGWKHKGGDFESHHPFRRRTRWATCCSIPFCTSCHHTIENNATQARKDGWIIDYKLLS